MHELELNPENKQFKIEQTFPIFQLISLTAELIAKKLGCFVSPSTEISKCFFTVWMHLIFKIDVFQKQCPNELKNFSFFSPNLVEISQKTFSNQIIMNELVSNSNMIDKYKRNFKHILRSNYIEQRFSLPF